MGIQFQVPNKIALRAFRASTFREELVVLLRKSVILRPKAEESTIRDPSLRSG